VNAVELSCQLSGPDRVERTLEVAVNVIRMVFVLSEGTVRENLADTDLPKLPRKNREVVD
jgi:hypothetical protein